MGDEDQQHSRCIRCMRVNGNFASNRNGTNMAKPSKSGLLFSSLDTGTFQAIQYAVTQRQKQRQTLGPQSGDSTTNQHRFLLHAESALCVMISLRDQQEDSCMIKIPCAKGYVSPSRSTASLPVAPGDALRKPDAGGWAGTFGCTFGMASMASIILWFVHAENVQNPLKMRSRKTTQRIICCTKKDKYTETYTAWCWCIRNEKTNSTLRLVLVCTSKSGIGLLSLWNYHRYSPTEWKNWTELWPPANADSVEGCPEMRWGKTSFLLDPFCKKHLFDALKSQIHQYTIYIYLQQSGWVCNNQSEQSWHVRTWMNTPNFKSW